MLLPQIFHCQNFEYGVTYAGILPKMFGCGSTDTLILSGLGKALSDCSKCILFLSLTLISFCIYLSMQECVVVLEIHQY